MGDTQDTTAAIMEATYRALCEHGYPETTISKIAQEFEKSQSLLYYHYEDKEELLEDFLEYLLDQLQSELVDIEASDPHDELVSIVERLLPQDIDTEQMRFRRALHEIRSQAPYNEAFRERFRRSDEMIRSKLIETIERGIEVGVFRPVNSQEVADFVYSATLGATDRGVTLGDQAVIDSNRQIIDSYLERTVVSRA